MSLENIWFTSDLHLGHDHAVKARGFSSVIEHDWAIITSLNSVVKRRDKIFILGDVVWNVDSLKLLKEIHGTKELIIGNHDNTATKEYLEHFTKVHGFRKYKHFWLSHCPIHPQEVYRCRGNIHGHIHNGGATASLGYPYFNVNIDCNQMNPVNFSTILRYFEEREGV
jgi:calcineurin-like phosphoesterase family protein